jgi:hypothetical protein
MEWIRRYGPAELAAVLGALAGYLVMELATGNHAAAAYGAAIGDNLAYYGVMLAREARAHGLAPAVRRLAVEFGPAEALDFAVVRPGCTAIATAALGAAAGVLVAKVVADLLFYVPVIATYELRKSRTRRVTVTPQAEGR